MTTALTALAWLAALAVTLYASEKLVHYLSLLGREVAMPAGLLGLLVALGADAPEVTSALVAVASGSTDVGLGVVLGSNIYNLAGLLGLSAIVAGSVATQRYWLALDGGANVLLTALLVLLLILPAAHVPLGLAMVLVLGMAALAISAGPERVLASLHLSGRASVPEHEYPEETPAALPPLLWVFVLLAASAACIVGGSEVLVRTSISLASVLHVPASVLGTFVLAIATSLPNTWAAISLARRGLPAAAVATTFNSNSINAALGAGVPSLFMTVHASSAARHVDAPWLVGMTLLALGLLATRGAISRRAGFFLAGLYGLFVVVRLAVSG